MYKVAVSSYGSLHSTRKNNVIWRTIERNYSLKSCTVELISLSYEKAEKDKTSKKYFRSTSISLQEVVQPKCFAADV